MAEQNSLRATLIIRNDTAATWASKNPKLAKGEMGVEIDTGLMKIGDGLLNYNALPYLNDGNQSLDGVLVKLNNNSQVSLANFGEKYWKYDTNTGNIVEVTETDLSKWPTTVELEIHNGTPRWVAPRATFNKLEGTIDGVLVTLSNLEPIYDAEAASKYYVDNTIDQKIATAGLLSRQIVSTLPANPRENVIYMIKDNSVVSGDAYKEYLVINNTLTQIGDTTIDLSGYAQITGTLVPGNLIQVGENGVLIDSGIDPSDIGALTVATTSRLGGVLSSNAANSVSVGVTGIMSLNQVSTNLLYVPDDGSELILNGGTA